MLFYTLTPLLLPPLACAQCAQDPVRSVLHALGEHASRSSQPEHALPQVGPPSEGTAAPQQQAQTSSAIGAWRSARLQPSSSISKFHRLVPAASLHASGDPPASQHKSKSAQLPFVQHKGQRASRATGPGDGGLLFGTDDLYWCPHPTQQQQHTELE